MDEIVKNVIEKVSSYHIFNYFFPGIIFCWLIDKVTRVSISTGEVWKDIFIYYFVGMTISRIGSIYIEAALRSVKIPNKDRKKEPFLNFIPYGDYITASKKDGFIKTLNEMNNTYRTLLTVFIVATGVKLYAIFFYDMVQGFGDTGNSVSLLILFLLTIILFVNSYRKQTDYIKKRVEKALSNQEKYYNDGGKIK